MNILFADLNLPIINKEKSVLEIEECNEDLWFFNEYRSLWMLTLMSSSGDGKLSGATNRTKPTSLSLKWTTYAPKTIVDYFENHIFIWMTCLPRIMILKTFPGNVSKTHIDCSPEEFGTRQHKFRIVLQGESNSLYFESKNGRIQAPKTEYPFIIDGSWPHGLVNDYYLPKYTIAVGSPWEGEDNYPLFNQVQFKYDLVFPENFDDYFDSYYK